MVKKAKTSLAAKLGSKGRKAFDAHKGDETVLPGGGSLPEGIEHGIAQLVEVKFDTYKKGDNKGELFFYAAGTVVSPKTVTMDDGTKVPVQGLRTSIIEPLHDTPNRSRATFDDHLAWVLNTLRKLGLDTEGLELDDLEEACEELKESAPHFSFRTWKGEATKQYPNPRVNEQWGKFIEDFEEGEEDDEVEDETEDDEVVDEDEEEETDEEETEEEEDESEEDEPEEDEEEEEEEEEQSASELAELADEGDEEAEATLNAMCEEAGIDPNEYNTWAAVAEALDSPDNELGEEDEEEEETEEEEEEEEEIEPEKGDVYLFKPPKARKSVECEVTAVFKSKKTVNLKSLDNGKLYKSVGWDKLSEE